MTVDWTRWMELSADEQRALWNKYRQIISDETQAARYSNFRKMDEAIRNPFGRRHA